MRPEPGDCPEMERFRDTVPPLIGERRAAHNAVFLSKLVFIEFATMRIREPKPAALRFGVRKSFRFVSKSCKGKDLGNDKRFTVELPNSVSQSSRLLRNLAMS